MTGRIIGLGSYIPKKVVTNDDFAKFLDTSDEWITERTGIKERHIADHITEKPSTMAVEAAKKAVEDAGIDPKDIDLIVTASTTSDSVIPALSCIVQRELGVTENCGCFDVVCACPGFIVAFNTVQGFIESGNSKTALVIGTECNSNFANYEDRGTCILFGDGAGAAVLKAEDIKRNEFIMRSSGYRSDCLRCEAARQPDRWEEEGFKTATSFYMQGREVFKFAVSEVPQIIKDLAEKYSFDLENDVDYFILHQANARIIEATAKKLGIDRAKFPMNIMNYGNVSSASIPMLLAEMKQDGRLKPGMKLVLASFGAGLTWDANYIVY
ncbi:3-oxoacyl-ACP synthase III family protein [Butyrivibrio sp. AE2032]|uniref:3-oxoacyl-ACP synthase III family protein n=1 Tax=Butyrivibrio sp. AE2032 TaxID=1458463 RepID=UPI00054F12C0|nr:beta-ketoacyl-ACP synthase III [Butyrivibrio sp. AE2032]